MASHITYTSKKKTVTVNFNEYFLTNISCFFINFIASRRSDSRRAPEWVLFLRLLFRVSGQRCYVFLACCRQQLRSWFFFVSSFFGLTDFKKVKCKKNMQLTLLLLRVAKKCYSAWNFQLIKRKINRYKEFYSIWQNFDEDKLLNETW